MNTKAKDNAKRAPDALTFCISNFYPERINNTRRRDCEKKIRSHLSCEIFHTYWTDVSSYYFKASWKIAKYTGTIYCLYFLLETRSRSRPNQEENHEAENVIDTNSHKSIDDDVGQRRIDNTAQSMSSTSSTWRCVTRSSAVICIIVLSALS